MKKIFTLLFLLTILYQCQAQNWVHDTIYTGAGYKTNVYYSLGQGTVGTSSADNWHVGFSTSRFSDAIITNSADAGVKLYEITTDTSLFGTDMRSVFDSVVTVHPMSFYNSNETWFSGAFNQGSASYGWGDYDNSTHWIAGRVIFGLITDADTFQVFIRNKQTTPSGTSPVYEVSICTLEGTAMTHYQLDASTYSDQNFVYFDITSGLLSREPAAEDWDFVFSSYNDEGVVFNNAQYKVFGIINNEGLKVAKVDTPQSEFENLDYMSYDYDSVNNSIGRAWKSAGPGGTFVKDSITYFVKTQDGNIWQLVFTDIQSGSASVDPGQIILRKRMVDNETALQSLELGIRSLALAPNPTTTQVAHLVMDIERDLGEVDINISDITGRTLLSLRQNIGQGLHAYDLDLHTLSTGFYLVTLAGAEGTIASAKLMIQ